MRIVTATRWLIVAAIFIESLAVAGFVLGHHGAGLDLPDFGGRLDWDGQAVMTAEGSLRQPPVVDIDLEWETTSEGTVDASTGLSPVSLTGPFIAQISILSPTALERVVYVLAHISVPLLAIGVLWLLHRLVSSVGSETPFTAENARRVWLVALIVGVGGTLAGVYTQWVDAWLISNSAAASAFDIRGFVSFTPLLIGMLLSVLAVAWTRGVALQEDSQGLV